MLKSILQDKCWKMKKIYTARRTILSQPKDMSESQLSK